MASLSNNTTSNNNLQQALLGVLVVLLWSLLNHVREHGLSSSTSNNKNLNSNDAFQRTPEWLPREDLDAQVTETASTQEERLQRVQEEIRKTRNKQNYYTSSGPTVINSFLHDEVLLTALSDPETWRECQTNKFRWLDAAARSSSTSSESDDGKELSQEQQQERIWEDLARRIWHGRKEADGIVGYEYWCHILSPHTQLEWHVDKDEVYYAKSGGKLKLPTMGAVFYGHPHSFRGGYLEMVGHAYGGEHPTNTGGEIERIRAEYNRLVILNVSQWHRVTEVTSGARYGLAVNIWHEKPMGI